MASIASAAVSTRNLWLPSPTGLAPASSKVVFSRSVKSAVAKHTYIWVFLFSNYHVAVLSLQSTIWGDVGTSIAISVNWQFRNVPPSGPIIRYPSPSSRFSPTRLPICDPPCFASNAASVSLILLASSAIPISGFRSRQCSRRDCFAADTDTRLHLWYLLSLPPVSLHHSRIKTLCEPCNTLRYLSRSFIAPLLRSHANGCSAKAPSSLAFSHNQSPREPLSVAPPTQIVHRGPWRERLPAFVLWSLSIHLDLNASMHMKQNPVRLWTTMAVPSKAQRLGEWQK